MANTFTYLHLETLRVHNSSSENYKNSNQKPAQGAILVNRASQICACVQSCGKVPGKDRGHFLTRVP